VIAAGLVFLWWKSRKWQKSLAAADIIKPASQTPQTVDSYPKSNDFRLSALGETFRPTTGTTTDNPQAIAFKNSLKDMYRLIQFTRKQVPPVKTPVQISVPAISISIIQQVNPEITIPAWTWQQVLLPGWISDQLPVENFVEAMAYPKINKPMY
jgi:hypothetical protein